MVKLPLNRDQTEPMIARNGGEKDEKRGSGIIDIAPRVLREYDCGDGRDYNRCKSRHNPRRVCSRKRYDQDWADRVRRAGHGRLGLAYVDGHADFATPQESGTGSAASARATAAPPSA